MRVKLALTLTGQAGRMMQTHSFPNLFAVVPAFSPDQWLYQLFSPLAVAQGSTLRRRVSDIEANIGRDRFLREAALRGYRAEETADEIVLILNRTPVRVMV